jgi:hypothetical protein
MRRVAHLPSLLLTATLFVALTTPALAGQRSSGRGGSAREPSPGGARAVPKGSGETSGGEQGGGSATATSSRESQREGNATATAASGGSDRSSSRPRTPTSNHSPDEGTAVARAVSRPPVRPDATILIPTRAYGFYPWGYGSYGFGGYSGGYYDPWYYGSYPVYVTSGVDDGTLRLKMKPRDATVYVDGYYAGRVDDFDGIFQRLRVEPGPHRIEIRADGYETHVLDVLVQRDRNIVYEADLKRLQ